MKIAQDQFGNRSVIPDGPRLHLRRGDTPPALPKKKEEPPAATEPAEPEEDYVRLALRRGEAKNEAEAREQYRAHSDGPGSAVAARRYLTRRREELARPKPSALSQDDAALVKRMPPHHQEYCERRAYTEAETVQHAKDLLVAGRLPEPEEKP